MTTATGAGDDDDPAPDRLARMRELVASASLSDVHTLIDNLAVLESRLDQAGVELRKARSELAPTWRGRSADAAFAFIDGRLAMLTQAHDGVVRVRTAAGQALDALETARRELASAYESAGSRDSVSHERAKAIFAALLDAYKQAGDVLAAPAGDGRPPSRGYPVDPEQQWKPINGEDDP